MESFNSQQLLKLKKRLPNPLIIPCCLPANESGEEESERKCGGVPGRKWTGGRGNSKEKEYVIKKGVTAQEESRQGEEEKGDKKREVERRNEEGSGRVRGGSGGRHRWF